MKENSIEEDVKILESIIKINNDYLKGVENQTINKKEIKALEHILSEHKRVLKENGELKEENEYNKLLLELNNNFTIDKKTGNYKWNVIEIQKIKDKIEEINKAYEDSKDENGESEYYYPDYTIRVLEELLESE